MPYQLSLESGSSHLGAQMGRKNTLPEDRLNADPLLHLTKIGMSADGAYDFAGAYWGIGAPIYCAEGDYGDESIRMFVRAADRETAKIQVRTFVPNARFYR